LKLRSGSGDPGIKKFSWLWWPLWWGLVEFRRLEGVWSKAGGFVLVRLAGISHLEDVLSFDSL
jgi:hypothetical protein